MPEKPHHEFKLKHLLLVLKIIHKHMTLKNVALTDDEIVFTFQGFDEELEIRYKSDEPPIDIK